MGVKKAILTKKDGLVQFTEYNRLENQEYVIGTVFQRIIIQGLGFVIWYLLLIVGRMIWVVFQRMTIFYTL